ncbi:MAG TPA: serine hydrolase domain-containing protein [Candidatus Koribacter sp.]|jgi:CubicO group peptidase (beta-lactamase class C family)
MIGERVTILCVLAMCCGSLWSQVLKPSEAKKTPEVTTARSPETGHEMTASDMEAFLDGMVPLQLQREDIAGAVVVVVKDGKVLFSKGYGYADVKKKVPVSPDRTLFRPGSISKTFTWTAVMQLVEEGKLNLDQDVNAYLDFTVPRTFGKPVTLRNLMTHTAGFEEFVKDNAVPDASQLTPLGAFVKAHQPKQIYVPGTIPAYSNYGADLAGYIVQRVSGMPFEEYVEEKIFKPLGMTEATFREPLPDALKPMMSEGYQVASQDPKPFELVPPKVAPDGSMSVSGADMARWMIAHLQNGKYGSAQILEPQTAELMHARQFGMDPAVNGMCLGFYEESRNGVRIISHGGDLQYFHSDMHLIPERGVGFFVSYNSVGSGSDVRSSLWHGFLDRYFPYSEPQTAAGGAAGGETVAGSYLTSRREETTILKALWLMAAEQIVSDAGDGTIEVDQMKDLAGNTKRWRGTGNGTYREVGGQDLLVFKKGPLGDTIMVTEDPTEIEQRVPWEKNKNFVRFVLGFIVVMFAGTLILWPVAASLRRHYKRPLTLSGSERRLRLVVKLACAVELGALVAFASFAIYGFSDFSVFREGMDPWLRLIQVGLVAGIVGAIAIVYNGYRVWSTRGTGAWAKIYATVLVLASISYVWFVLMARLLQVSLKY